MHQMDFDEMKKETRNEIKKTGAFVLRSDIFGEASRQTHHHCTTVASHCLHVAATSVFLCNVLEFAGVPVDRELVIIAALLHDMGIVGRYQKYANNRECYAKHPSDSAVIAGEMADDLLPERSGKLEEAIRRHMWPLNKGVPNSLEAWVLTIADKQASIAEVLPGRRHRKYAV